MEWTVDQLRQFVTTAECGSFSAAARHLGKAQSAVSTAVGLLEVDLGVELFDRSRRNAQLSEAGQVLLLEARELLRQADQLDQRARSLSGGSEAALSLALDEALPFIEIRTLLLEISTKFPNLELTLLNGTATEVADYVSLERARVAFQINRGPVSACFDQRHIGSMPQGVFVAIDHPLADGRTVERKDLVRHRQLLMHADDVREVAYSPSVWRSDSFYGMAEMVADKLGWAVLPVNVARYEGYRDLLQEVHCPSLALSSLPVRMIWMHGYQLGTVVQYMQQRLTELLVDGPGDGMREKASKPLV